MRLFQGLEDRLDDREFEADAVGDLHSGAVRVEVEQFDHQLCDQVLAQPGIRESCRCAEVDSVHFRLRLEGYPSLQQSSLLVSAIVEKMTGAAISFGCAAPVRLDVVVQTTPSPKDVYHHEHTKNRHHCNIQNHHNLLNE